MPKDDAEPHSRNLRLHRLMEGAGTFFVTKCLEPRVKVIDASIASTIAEALCAYQQKQEMYLASFVVMLDHWHALFATCDGKSISQRMEILGSWVGRRQERLSEIEAVNGKKVFMRRESGLANSSDTSQPTLKRILCEQDWLTVPQTGSGLRRIQPTSNL